MLKEAKLIKTHNLYSDVDNTENIYMIVFNAISQLNVNKAPTYKQMYISFDIDFEQLISTQRSTVIIDLY